MQDHLYSKNGYILHQKLLLGRINEIEKKVEKILNFFTLNSLELNKIFPKSSKVNSNLILDRFNCHSSIIVNKNKNFAIKENSDFPGFIFIKGQNISQITMIVNVRDTLGVGFANLRRLQENQFAVEESFSEEIFLFSVGRQQSA